MRRAEFEMFPTDRFRGLGSINGSVRPGMDEDDFGDAEADDAANWESAWIDLGGEA
jgi:hypothetical protein